MVNEPPASSERMMTPEVVVTGEAVALEVQAASAGLRILSGFIDYALYAIGIGITASVWVVFAPTSDATATALLAVQLGALGLFWLVLLPLAIEFLSHGRSAGKLVTGTRVVRDDGGAIRLRHSFVRVLLSVVEVWVFTGMLAVGSCLVTRRSKRLGDLLAGTYVVHTHSTMRSAPPLIMPPELAAWASQADLRALPGDLALVALTFLQRASTMQAQPRTRLGLQLAAAVEPYVAPPVPAGTHPERFLAAALVERRNREFMLELRDRRADQRWAAPIGGAGEGAGGHGAPVGSAGAPIPTS